MKQADRALLYWNTVKKLRPVQIRHQIGNRIWKGRRKRLLKRVQALGLPGAVGEIRILIPELDCEEQYLKRFSARKLLDNEIKILHESHSIEAGWNIPRASHLWNYNLHYLEFLIVLAAGYRETSREPYYRRWEELTKSWLGQFGRSCGDSLEPYTISLRIPNLLICMELLEERLKGTKLQQRLLASIYRQYRYLLQTQELALLANHYFENLKTVVISSLLFRELDIYHKYFDLFLRQIEEQILPDGVHYERSLMYHKIILEDILRVYKALDSSGHRGDGEKLVPAIQRMTAAMIDLEEGFRERTPLFNDAGSNVSKGRAALLRAARRLCGGIPDAEDSGGKFKIKAFGDSGYYKALWGRTALLFDCGDIGPAYMGGHGHCDCLSFELSADGEMLFVNSGTGQYQGKYRAFFRSTAAHNTVMIDDREQSELWGEHRAARRIRAVKGAVKGDALVGRFQSFQGDSFQRRITWKDADTLLITDDLRAHDNGMHQARQFLHLAPGCRYERDNGRITVIKGGKMQAAVRIFGECEYVIHTEGFLTAYAEDFGLYDKKQVLEIRRPFRGRVRAEIEIEIRNPAAE